MDGEARTPREQLLLQEGQALRALAQGLLRDDDVDDVVQSTNAAALASPPATDRYLGPWLRVTLRNLASVLRRGEARRRRRQFEVARPDADHGSDPAAMAMQAELVREVGAAVHALEEPFRTAILLRFWRGLLPEAIALELGVPRNTVRSRLQRGLERLREQLDREYGGRQRWSAPLGAAVGLQQSVAMLAGGGTALVVGVSMQGKLLVAAATVAVAAFFVPLLWQDPAASAPASTPAPLAPVAALSGARIPDTDAIPERHEVTAAAAPAVGTDVREVEVFVHDAITNAPIEGAAVLGHREPSPFQDRNGELGTVFVGVYAWERWSQWLYQQDIELGITAADGKAQVRARSRETLSARLGEQFGRGWIPPDATTVNIALALDRGVTIRAIDAEGHPVPGLPLAARVIDGSSYGRSLSGKMSIGITDDHGELSCPMRTLGGPRRVFVVPDLPGAWQTGGAAIDLAVEAPQRLTLQVPPLGALRAEMLDSDGSPYTGRTTFRLDEDGVRRSGTREDPDVGGLQWSLTIADGSIATWPYWALDQHVTISFSNPARHAVVTSDGPRREGETAVIQAREPADTPVLVGRLRGPDGSPLARRDIVVRFRAGRSPGAPRVRTDAEGRFRVGLTTNVLQAELEWVLIWPAQSGPDEPLLACQCIPGQRLLPGRFDLGDLMLAPPPLLVSGRIEADGLDTASVSLGIETGTLRDNGTLRWSHVEHLWAPRQPGGAFAMFAFGIEAPTRLVVESAQAAVMPPIPFAPGARDVIVQVSRGGSILGTLEAQGTERSIYQIELLDEASGRPSRSEGVGSSFALTGLARGFYTVRLRLAGDPEPLAEVRGVRVDAGSESRDPRLLPIRLSTPLRALHVKASAGGAPIMSGMVLVDGGGADGVGRYGLDNGETTIWTRQPAVDLWVVGSGLPPVPLRAVSTDVEVQLQPPRELTVRIQAASLPPGFVLLWDYELVHPDERSAIGSGHCGFSEWFGHGRRLQPDADGTCRLPILSEQPSRIACHVQRLNSDYWWAVPVAPAELPAGASEATISVQPADVQAAIQHLPDRDG